MPTRYRSSDEDSARWLDFTFRDGDIIISTRSKSGTTWMQMICALLIFGTPELPAPLSELSPWLDWLVTPDDTVAARLEAQTHRRFVKTHTPLDGVVIDPRATYIVVARHPLDMAVSLYHQSNNINRVRMRQSCSGPPSPRRPPPRGRISTTGWSTGRRTTRTRPPRWTRSPVCCGTPPTRGRVRHQANVVLVHYDDLSADLDGEMRRIAGRLGIPVPSANWAELVEAATFQRMRERARTVVPDPGGVLIDGAAFFRSGRSGGGAAVLTAAERERYATRVARMASPEVVAWLHRSR